ncbi:alpha/beta family hydrolase [Pseudohoeflea coraliihabitans]|uniref:Dienelactone hydrolase family protein n=1 Tax=Pseudohoeflea coraliihabitans TaxID=2860393 RepID=A0ABS6WSC8_9HYPH|nr:alpha/beta family hydrolase [Pseudohoeflea sp. DP4N28-3]MBW3098859.1 dienelactone hydrolase family protein [Pseudohoeflea sp. DP4N28-3]
MDDTPPHTAPVFLHDGPADAETTLLLAHGAGAAMDSPWMNDLAQGLGAAGLHVVRFEFAYMAARRQTGTRRPPPRAERLQGEFFDAVSALAAQDLAKRSRVLIGGKSMGGRVASMVADSLWREGRIAGVIGLGYPFHPPKHADRLRTAHLQELETPMLICQGERDPFGSRTEVESYALSESIRIVWLADGDHHLSPRVASGHTQAGHRQRLVEAIAGFTTALRGPSPAIR